MEEFPYGPAPSLADRLVAACYLDDLPSAQTAVIAGASVNEADSEEQLPLAAAVYSSHHDVVVWLLSQGADPNGDAVMLWAVFFSAPNTLQVVIDVGGDVNRECRERLPLFASVDFVRADNARVLLTEPSLDLTATVEAQTADVYARGSGELALADMIGEEVKGKARRVGGGGGGGVTLPAIAAVPSHRLDVRLL